MLTLTEKYQEIHKQIKKELDKDRYQHTLGVAYTAACLAMRYGADMEKAYLAGLLHDCAKCIPDGERLKLCRKWKIEATEFEKEDPSLLHAKMGAYLAEEEYGITDPEILSAVACHTTGKPDMSPLELILFIADYIEPNRNKAPELEKIRKVSFEDWHLGAMMIANGTIRYVSEKKKNLDPATKAVYEFYRKKAGYPESEE